MRTTRDLDAVEIRILGTLMEKQQATPEYYPMTMNALIAACNQKTNRDPVTELGESEVSAALERLQDEKVAWKVVGARATHFDHNLDRRWSLTKPEKAILTLLFLRGAQTAGELRQRSERLYNFETLEELEQELRQMSTGDDALIRQLPRRPGQKEDRWMHLASGEVEAVAAPNSVAAPTANTVSGEPLSQRVTRLEEEVATLRNALEALMKKLGE